ncbi:MAG: BatA domain-containing protein [Verrucomicrobia bacterium]|nr:BatA domain-containing protein [Verrucomicrobiota bacterium]
MFPFFVYPLALLALAALPVLAAIYLFRHRFRRRTVSSLLLWRFQMPSREGGAKIQRIQLPLLFFLELLALLCLVMAASGPQWRQPGAGRPLIVVLDDSFSMRAVYEAVSARDRALEYLERHFRRQPPPSVRLVLAGSQPRLAGAPVRTWSELARQLVGWTCHAPQAALEAALTLASELGNQQANILILTDHPPVDERMAGDRLRWHAFGQPSANLAIVNASRVSHAEQDRCLLEIANYAATPQLARVTVQAGSNTLQTSSLTLAPNERQRLVFEIPGRAPLLEAALEPDALGEDNTVQLLPPIRPRVRVQVAITNAAMHELLSRTLEVTGLRAALSVDPELVIHQASGAVHGTNAWDLRWVLPSAEEGVAFTGPFVIDTSHPLTEGLALEGMVWTAATNLALSPGTVPVITAGNIPLVLAREDALGRRHLTLNLDPGLSTLHNTPGWPILFWNLLRWRATEQPGLSERNFRLGAEVELRTAGQPATVTRPDGVVVQFVETSDRLSLETPLPGHYLVSLGTATNAFVVNPLAADESALTGCATGRWGGWKDEEAQRRQLASAVWIFGLAALAIMVVHLVLLAPRAKGSR